MNSVESVSCSQKWKVVDAFSAACLSRSRVFPPPPLWFLYRVRMSSEKCTLSFVALMAKEDGRTSKRRVNLPTVVITERNEHDH